MPSKTSVSCVRIGTLCRAINALEGLNRPYYPDENDRDVCILREILVETAENLVRNGAKIKDINKELHDAGWDDVSVSLNKSKYAINRLTWKSE